MKDMVLEEIESKAHKLSALHVKKKMRKQQKSV